MHSPLKVFTQPVKLLLPLIAFLLFGCQAKLLANDDFTEIDTNQWWLEGDAEGRAFQGNGQLVVEVNRPNTVQYASFRQSNFSDFAAQIDVTQISGSLNNSQGLIVRRQPDGSFYHFAITGNGHYIVERRDNNGAWSRLTSNGRWEKSDVINQGLGATNRLRVTFKTIDTGIIAIFEVNDQVVYRRDQFDTAYINGTIGLSAGTFASGSTQVAFDNFFLREPR